MVLKFKVSVKFVFVKGKAQLSKMYLSSINSTWDKLLIYPIVGHLLSYYRKFYTPEQAQEYINYLYTKYPNYSAPLPVLDGGQKELFKELSK